jgi:hypothetical protein
VFTSIGAALADIPSDPADRCALAPHDGPDVEIRIDGPRVTLALDAPRGDLVVSAPAVGFRKVEWEDTNCWGRVFSRTKAAFVQCTIGAVLVAVAHDKLWVAPFLTSPWPPGFPLPCNARIRWRLSMSE